MRERGYHGRIVKAWSELNQPKETRQMDKFVNTNKEYYAKLKEGTADVKDFERYIYGSNNRTLKDDRDIMEEKERQEIARIGRNL